MIDDSSVLLSDSGITVYPGTAGSPIAWATHSVVSGKLLSHLGGHDGKVSGPESVTGMGIL